MVEDITEDLTTKHSVNFKMNNRQPWRLLSAMSVALPHITQLEEQMQLRHINILHMDKI